MRIKLIVAFLSICFHPLVIGASQINVVASIKPLALLVKDIGGDRVSVSHLVPNMGSIHHYSMRVSDRMEVANADLVVLVGAGLEPFLSKIAAEKSSKILRMDRLNNLHTLPLSETHDHSHTMNDDTAHEQDFTGGAIDPHLWLNPHNAIQLAIELSTRLSTLDPDNATNYQKRANQVVKSLELIKSSNRDRANNQAEKDTAMNYFAYHNAYAYLLEVLDIVLQGELTTANESRVGMRSLYEVKQRASQAGRVCVLVSSQAKQATIKMLGDVRTRDIDVLGNVEHYPSFNAYLTAMLSAIVDC